MSVKLFCGEGEYPVKTFNFPGGELQVQVEDIGNYAPCDFVIEMDYRSNEDLIAMLLLVDICRHNWPNGIHLDMPYVPYARQDRRMTDSEAHSLKVVAAMVNSCNFKTVWVTDPHSDVVEALFNNVHIKHQFRAFMQTVPSINIANAVLVSPDAGALKKIFKVAKETGIETVVCASKIRDVATGNILKTSLSEEDGFKIGGKDVWVVDDICDGGRTFVELAKVLAPYMPKSQNLFITHGIFSKGKEELLQYYGGVFSYNDWTK